jgi:hypothetical protein
MLRDNGCSWLLNQQEPLLFFSLSNSDGVQGQYSRSAAAELTTNGDALISTMATTPVDVKSHGFIVCPATGDAIGIGNTLPLGATHKPEDMGSFKPRSGNLDLGHWSFAIEDEDYCEFDELFLTPNFPWDMHEHEKWENYRIARDAVMVMNLIQASSGQSGHSGQGGQSSQGCQSAQF